jgi:hypothetical protein
MRAIYVEALRVFVSVATIVVFGQNWAKADAPRPGPPPDGLWIGQQPLTTTDGVQRNSTSSMERCMPTVRMAFHRRCRAGRGSAQYDDTVGHDGKCLPRRHTNRKSSASWCGRCLPMRRSRLVYSIQWDGSLSEPPA